MEEQKFRANSVLTKGSKISSKSRVWYSLLTHAELS
jgi:hypothetical protein